VLGGGFGGVSVARALEKDKRVDVVLVDQKPFFESTPGPRNGI
jgi:NADH dehydrogenase FAD-containing subunit